MCRLVRIDGGVLDDGLARIGVRRLGLAAQAREQVRRPVQVQIHVAVRRRNRTRDAGNPACGHRQFLSNRARRLAQRAGELERDGDRKIAERAIRRHLDGERRDLGDAEHAPDGVGNVVVHLALDGEDHRSGRTRSARPDAQT